MALPALCFVESAKAYISTGPPYCLIFPTMLGRKFHGLGKKVPRPWEKSLTALGKKFQRLEKEVPTRWERSFTMLEKKFHRIGKEGL
ncbi:MAG: hypothetical protein LBN24_03880 [Mediterranea sp.]|jgi:hypothetical protein|nr:hypothetical protein [Mediterranea sp.]